jgi:quercetin dioxygenase-like cupin family protein
MGRGGDELSLTPGQTLTIVESSPERLEVEAVYAPGGSPPPPHFHPSQDEHFEVLEGTLQAILGDDPPLELTVGDDLDIPRETVHRMWNGAAGQVRVRWITEPAGRTEAWFRGIDELHRRNAEGGVEPQEFVDLLNSYSDVIRIVMPPPDAGER